MFLVKKIPLGDIPVLSESIAALPALTTGWGLLYRKRWSVPCCLVLAGMWAYGVIGGIALVMEPGLSFDSPFGSNTDAIIFPLILLFAIWSNREQFMCAA
jgi:hypothetical protein